VFLKDKFSSTVNHIVIFVNQISFSVQFSSLLVESVSIGGASQNWHAICVHVKVTKYPTDVEASEWEDLGELSVLKLCFIEQDSALPCANMAILVNNVSLLVHHESSLVHEYIFALLIFTLQHLDVAIAVAIKHAHDFLNLKSFALIVIHLGHESAIGFELGGCKDLPSRFVNKVAHCIDHEALQGHLTTQFIKVVIPSLCFLEAQWVI